MKHYKMRFTGRKKGSLGLLFTFEDIGTGTTLERAILSLYDRYEHVSFSELLDSWDTERA